MRTLTSCLVIAGLLGLSAPALAGDASARLLALQGAGDTYEAGLTALVEDAAISDQALLALADSDDWRLRHQNAASPEFVETLLKGARRVHQSQRLAHVRDAPTASVGSLKVKGPGSLTGSRRVADLDERLGEAKAAEMANLDRLAHVSLT